MLDSLRTPDERFDDLPDFPFSPNYLDNLQGFEGPMAGLATGLRRCTTDYLVTAPCDSPFLPAHPSD